LFLIGFSMTNAQILHFDMDETSSTNLSDKSGNRNNAVIIGDASFVPNRFNVPCRAMQFKGDSYLNVAHSASLDVVDEFSLSTWVKLPTGNSVQWLTLLCKGENSSESNTSPAYRVQLTSSTASVNFKSTKEISSRSQNSDKAQLYPTDEWFHLVVVYKSGSYFGLLNPGRSVYPNLSIYKNGQLYRSYDFSTELQKNSENLNIGRDVPGGLEFLIGALDDYRLYNRALSSQEIMKIFNDRSDSLLPDGCPDNISVPDWGAVIKERNAKEQAERKKQEEADLRTKREAERKAQEQKLWDDVVAQSKAKEQAERKKQEEADLRAKKEAEQKAQERMLWDDIISQSKVKEAEEKRLADEAKAKAKAEKEARIKAEREAASKKAENERLAREAEEKRLADEAKAKAKAREEARIKSEREVAIKNLAVELEGLRKEEQRKSLIEKVSAANENRESLQGEMRKEVFNKLSEFYPSGITFERDSTAKMVIDRYIVVNEGEVLLYEQIYHSWGGKFYFRTTSLKKEPLTEHTLEQFLDKHRSEILIKQTD
jgi:hypothetical protein